MILQKKGVSPEKRIGFGQFALAGGQVCLFTAFILGKKAGAPLLDGDFTPRLVTLTVIAAVLFGISVPLHVTGILAMRRRRR